MVRPFFVLILIYLLLVQPVLSQSNFRENDTQSHAWFMYFGNHKISKSLGIHVEAQLRRSDFLSGRQQLLLRTGLDYYLNQVRVTVGYAFIETYPYGDFPVANAFPEHRMWQQALVSNPIGKLKLSHRYRLEQRWLGNSATGEFQNGRYENRFRYMARINIPLQGKTIEPNTFYLGFYNEVFINFGKEVGYNVFDQNRLYGALGYHLGKVGRLEVGYLYQLLQQRRILSPSDPRTIFEHNHTLQIALISELPWYREKTN